MNPLCCQQILLQLLLMLVLFFRCVMKVFISLLHATTVHSFNVQVPPQGSVASDVAYQIIMISAISYRR